LKLYEAFAKPVFFLKLALLLLNRAFIDQSFGENCPNCRKAGGKMSQDF
jgi:hypothetical protein